MSTASPTAVLLARNFLRASSPWTGAFDRLLRVFVRSGPSANQDLFFSNGWQHPGTDWENPLSVVPLSSGSWADTDNDPALARAAASPIDVHPTVAGGSEAIGAGLVSRPGVEVQAGAPAEPTATSLLPLLGFLPRRAVGFYGNERPSQQPAIGAAEPVGWREYPILLYGVAETDLGPNSTISNYADLGMKGVGLQQTRATAGSTVEQEAEYYWTVSGFVLPYARAAGQAGIKVLMPIALASEGTTPIVSTSTTGLTAGLSFTVPYSLSGTSTYDQIDPAYVDWASERIALVIESIENDPLASEGIAGFWGLEEMRPNGIGEFRDYYWQVRVRRLIEAKSPGRLFMTYMGNAASPQLLYASMFVGLGGPTALWPNGLVEARMGPLPATQPSFFDYAQALLADAGVGADLERRWRLFDGRGFDAVQAGNYSSTNQATWPTDVDGNLAPQFDPEYYAGGAATAVRRSTSNTIASGLVDADGTTYPFADPSWPQWDASLVYRPWEAIADYLKSMAITPDALGFQVPVTDHLYAGAYVDRLLLGSQVAPADENRSIARHMGAVRRDTMRGVAQTLRNHFRQDIGPNKTFHVPELDSFVGWPASAAHARHDFWAGVELADGVGLYQFGERFGNQTAWQGYGPSFFLFKQVVREFLVAGERIDTGFAFTGATAIPGGPTSVSQTVGRLYYEGSIGSVPPQEVINASVGYRIATKVLVIVTSSFAQQSSFQLGALGVLNGAGSVASLLPTPNINVAPGPAGATNLMANGIDATVLLFTL